MSNKRLLKAFVRYDGSGKIIPGGNILAKKEPEVGNWTEISAYECCNSTTTTTTGIPGCVTYRYVQGDVSRLLSYTDCDGTPRGPLGMNGIIDDTFCALENTYSVDDTRGVTITYLGEDCFIRLTTTPSGLPGETNNFGLVILCDGEIEVTESVVAGTNFSTMELLLEELNTNPDFSQYGTYSDGGSGTIVLYMPGSVEAATCAVGPVTFTLQT